MSTQLSGSGYVCCDQIFPEILERYAARRPMTQLPDKYRVTESNPNPPLVSFGIPIDAILLYYYAVKHGFAKKLSYYPTALSPDLLFKAVEILSEHVEYELQFGLPFTNTSDCGSILILYDNYTIEDRILFEEDEEDVIQMVQEALGLDESMRPKWYFDVWDPYEPDDSDEDTKTIRGQTPDVDIE